MPITANIITLNEEKHIKACIESLQPVCDEIVVVDSGSHDDTVRIAESMGAKIVHQPYLGDGFQKNVALEHASNDWILSLDADERVTPGMQQAIQNLTLEGQEQTAFAFRRRNMIGSRWIKHCGWYPDYCARLYNRKFVKFKEVKQHSSLDTANVTQLPEDIIHYSFKNIGELFAKPGRNFSSRSAKIMYAKHKKVSRFSPVMHGFNAFCRKYFFKLGFLDGMDGLTVSISSAINSYLKYAKLIEYYRDPSVTKQDDFKNIW
ncbi:glycosyltransferase family 2 protein [Celerinatantimonas sp. YJH-8]|uniref:glycosyltransferase family 2 protein n=1 Tax=Celerinatantimonas sp. YJH-8 TaxID=3228714 RepID=UPI0038C3D8C2